MTKLKIKLNRKTRRVEIMPQPASEHIWDALPYEAALSYNPFAENNEQILFGVFGATGNPCVLEFYNARRDMRRNFEKVMNLFREVK